MKGRDVRYCSFEITLESTGFEASLRSFQRYYIDAKIQWRLCCTCSDPSDDTSGSAHRCSYEPYQ
jgi:hypothetical protein